jgi:hypothetical protein
VTAAIQAELTEVHRSLQWAGRQLWEARVLLVALHDFQHGKKAKLRAWMKQRYGTKPDPILGAELRADELKIKDDTDVGPMVAFVRHLLDGHNLRLTEKRERERRAEAEKMRDSFRKVGETGRTLAQYNENGQVTEVHRAMFEVERSLRPGEILTSGKVDWRVRYDNRSSHVSVDSPRRRKALDATAHNAALWHTATPQDEKSIAAGQTVWLDGVPQLAKFFGDPKSLAPHLAVEDGLLLEWLEELARQRLTSGEFAVFAMMRSGYKQYEMASRLGVTKGRVSQLVKQVHQKLADIA